MSIFSKKSNDDIPNDNVNTINKPLRNITRKEFHNDTLVDFYKDRYLNILKNMKSYDILALEDKKLSEDINMLTELLLRISFEEDLLDDEGFDNKVNFTINIEKLKLYKSDIDKLQEEASARLIALLEIKKEYSILNGRKKAMITSAINSLSLSLDTLDTEEINTIESVYRFIDKNKYADLNEYALYLENDMKGRNLQEEANLEINESLEEKIFDLNLLQTFLPEEEQIELNKNSESIYQDLATLERKIEIFAYQNKESILKEKDDELNRLIGISPTLENKDYLLDQIKQVETRFRLFADYGRNIINDNDLYNLYSIKFQALTISSNGLFPLFVNEQTDELELLYYERIVEDLLEEIITKKNRIFNKLYSDNIEEYIEIIKRIYKLNEVEKIDYENILKDYILINLLCSFNSKKRFLEFYRNLQVSRNFYPDHLIELEDQITMEMFCYLESALKNSQKVDANEDFNNNEYYNLYLLFKNLVDGEYVIDEEKFFMPLGITALKDTKNATLTTVEKCLVEEINDDCKGKVLYTPKSLKSISGTHKLFYDNTLKGIVLNEGLEEIKDEAFLYQQIKEVSLPSSVKKVGPYAFDYYQLEKIVLNVNLTNYHLLDKENLLNILNNNVAEDENHLLFKNGNFKELVIHIDNLFDININLSNIKVSKLNNDLNNEQIYALTIVEHINDILQDKRKKFQRLQNILPKEDRMELRSDIPELLIDLSNIDLKLKSYINSHQDEREKLNEDYLMNLANNPKEFTANLEDLENKLNVYSYYGLINSDVLKYFYEIKFTILTSEQSGIRKSFINDEMTNEELQCYYDIVDNILAFNKPNNSKAFTYKDVVKEKIKLLIRDILKNNHSDFDKKEILSNDYLLNMLFILQNPNSIFQFCENFKIPSSIVDESTFKFSKEISLETFSMLNYYMGSDKEVKLYYEDREFLINQDFYNLYHLISNNVYLKDRENLISDDVKDAYYSKPENFFFMPEDITEIVVDDNLDDSTSKRILEGIRRDAQDKEVVMPKTLKRINGDIFKGTSINGLILNEGLEKIDLNMLQKQNISSLTIPSTVKEVTGKDEDKLSNITLNNYDSNNYGILYSILDNYIKPYTRNGLLLKIFTNLSSITFHYDEIDEDIICDINPKSLAELNVNKWDSEELAKKRAIEDLIADINKNLQTSINRGR